MAEDRMMTAADVALQVMGGEHGDLLRDAIVLVCREVMEAEITARVGAEHGERSSERTAHRNGYRPRGWETRVGEIELLIPRARSGPAYFPSFLEPRRRSEQAIVAVVLEAYVTASRPARSIVSSSSWASRGWTRTASAGCAGRWTSRSSCFVSARSTAAIPICGWTPSS
jgi:hypothetical protein